MKRNYGVDIARVLAMFMVVVIHNLNQGGVLKNTTSTLGFLSSYEMFNLSIVAVNIFALITGYLYSGKGIKLKRVVGLYFEVLALSIFSLLVYLCFFGMPLKLDIVKSFFPLSSGVFWYFNAYVGFVMIEPLLRRGIKNISRNSLLKVECVLLLFSGTIGFTDTKSLQYGYSIEWIIILFIAGVLIKEYEAEISKIKSIFLIIAVFLMSFATLVAEFIFKSHAGHFPIYTSPAVIVQSITLFVLITRIKVKSPLFQNILLFVSPLSFGVYILDTSIMFYGYFLKDMFKNITINQPTLLALVIVLLCSLLFFTIFILINYVRVKFFELLGINKIIDKTSYLLSDAISKISI